MIHPSLALDVNQPTVSHDMRYQSIWSPSCLCPLMSSPLPPPAPSHHSDCATVALNVLPPESPIIGLGMRRL